MAKTPMIQVQVDAEAIKKEYREIIALAERKRLIIGILGGTIGSNLVWIPTVLWVI